MVEDKELYTIEEASAFWGRSVKTVRGWCRDGKVGCMKDPGGKWLIPKSVLMGGKETEQTKDEGNEDDETRAAKKAETLAERKRRADEHERGSRMAKANIESVDDIEGLRKSNNERKLALDAREQTLTTKEADVKALESGVLAKQMSIQGEKEQIIKEFRARWNEQDKQRQRVRQTEVLLIDELARVVYNSSPQSIGKFTREAIILALGQVFDCYGLKAYFNKRNEYIPVEFKDGEQIDPSGEKSGWMGMEVKEGGREKPEIPLPDDVPKLITDCYDKVVFLYNAMLTEPVYGHDFCNEVHPICVKLKALVKDGGGKDHNAIAVCFNSIHGAVMRWAEEYQNAKTGDWSAYSDWLCDFAIMLEDNLGVGVAQ